MNEKDEKKHVLKSDMKKKVEEKSENIIEKSKRLFEENTVQDEKKIDMMKERFIKEAEKNENVKSKLNAGLSGQKSDF